VTALEERTLIEHYAEWRRAESSSCSRSPIDPAIVSKGRAGCNLLVAEHAKLIRSLARKLLRSLNLRNSLIEYDDLFSAGIEGLLVAVQNFRSDLNVRLATHATWWIRNRMFAFLRQERWITRIPDPIYRDLVKIAREIGRLSTELGREPTTPELAATLGYAEARINRSLRWLNEDRISLDQPVGDGDSTLGDFVADKRGDIRGTADMRQVLEQSLQILSPREQKILRQRYGVDCEPQSAAAVAREIGITVTSVHYITHHAFRKVVIHWDKSARHARTRQLIREAFLLNSVQR
jgi:RNA polymerase primary sigma factor